MVIDPPYGLKVADWDDAPYPSESLAELLSAVSYINLNTSFNLVIFCEWSRYPEYVKVVSDSFGPRVGHISPHVLLKKVFGHGQDLVNAVEVAVYARIGDRQPDLGAKPDGNNVFGSIHEGISFLKDHNNKTLNPAQKPYEAIKTLIETYIIPGEYVLDVFAGSGQCARAASELGIGSVSLDKDPIQMGFLREFLQKASTLGVPSTAVYPECNRCSKVIAQGEGGMTCKFCGKPMHRVCAVQGTVASDHFCSEICKSSVL